MYLCQLLVLSNYPLSSRLPVPTHPLLFLQMILKRHLVALIFLGITILSFVFFLPIAYIHI